MPKSLVPNQFDYAGVYVEGQRSYFKFDKTHLASFMSGMLVPMGDPIHIFPGVKAELLMDCVIRSNTMIVPPLDGIYIDTFCVWIPHRIVWTSMPQFLGENDTTAWTQSVEKVYPYVAYQTINNTLFNSFDSHDLSDIDLSNLFLSPHYGLFANKTVVSGDAIFNQKINILAYRGYYAAWNHFWRDENYQRPVLFSKGDSGTAGEFGYALLDYETNGGVISDLVTLEVGVSIDQALLMPVNKFHDWSTSVLPQAQFGAAVEFGMAGEAVVKLATDLDEGFGGNPQIWTYDDHTYPVNVNLGTDSMAATVENGDASQLWLNPNGSLYADLSTATAITINQLRSAVMLQRFREALARGGRRVCEFYENIYNVKNSEAAKDYPQMMSHQRYPLNVTQVVAQSDSSDSGWTSHLGDTGAYSLTVLRNIPVCKGEFTEFGYLHILYCVRADNRYFAVTPKHFTYQTLLDEYNPYFDHIGDVDVSNFLVNNLAKSAGNFGFQEAWWEERSQQGLTVGALNKNYGSLGHWVLGEVFDDSLVTCTPAYLVFNPAVFNDTFVSNYSGYPQFIMDCRIHGRTAKRMSLHSVPGISGRI